MATSTPTPTVATAVATSGQQLATAGAGVTITGTESEFRISLGVSSIAPGKVTFSIKNDGTVQHEFVVLKTDMPEDKLPVNNNVVDESAPGIQKIDEIVNIDPGTTGTLTIQDLKAGTYVIICNKPAHYAAGMHTTLHVH